MNKEGKFAVYAMVALAVVVAAMALSALLVLKPYYQGMAVEGEENLGALEGDGGEVGVASIPGDISTCEIIDYGPGVYTLDRNLTLSGGTCFDVRADNVTLNCQGNMISGEGTGILIQNLENTTIENCLFDGLNYSVDVVNSSGSTIENNFVDHAVNFGVRIRSNSTNNLVQNNIFDDILGTGISIEAQSGLNTLQGNNMTSGFYGISVEGGYSNILSSNRISLADYSIRIYGSSGDRMDSNIVTSSNIEGALLNASTYTSFSRDSFDGIGIYSSHHSVLNNVVSSDEIYSALSTNATIYNATTKGSGGITAESCRTVNITASTSSNEFYFYNSSYCSLFNNSISGSGGSGIELLKSNHSTILNNSVKSNGDSGIKIVNSSNNSIISNSLVSNDENGIAAENSFGNNISFNMFSGSTVYDIFVSAAGNYGCRNDIINNSETSGRSIFYYNRTLTASDTLDLRNITASEVILCNADYSYIENSNATDGGGFLLVRTSHAILANLSSKSNYYGVALYSSSNNTFNNPALNSPQSSSILLSSSSSNNIFYAVSVTNRTTSYDIKFLDSTNGTVINNSLLGKYDFGFEGGKVIFENSYGSIKFLSPINGSGTNLSSDIMVFNSTASVNSAKEGLNITANITLYSVRTDFSRPAILRNNYLCPATICTNFTGLNAGTVKFHVTGWTNYTISEGYNELTSCATLGQNSTIYRLIQPVSSAVTCFNITAENVTLECMNWNNTIVYGNSSSTISYYGVYSSFPKTKVLNCQITMGELADSTLERYAIYYYGGSEGKVYNTNASGNRQGIVINSSFNNVTGNIAGYNSQTGIYLISNSNNTIFNNTANNNKFGIRIYWISDGNNMTRNTANNNLEAGLYMGPSSDNNYIAYNNATNNTYGLKMITSSSNRISSNTLPGNDYSIFLNGSSSNTIDSNKLEGNSLGGIFLAESSNSNTISSNRIMANNASANSCGVYVVGSTGNTISSNNITSNYYGVRLNGSSSNTIYNNRLNNTIDGKDSGTNNWNTTRTLGTNIFGGPYIGGNLWSNYTGWDIDGDGLGNVRIPHNSSGNIASGGDYLPLTEVNSAPNLTVVFVNSTLGTNLTTEDIICWANATEIDLDNITYYGRWYKNNALNSSFSRGVYTQGVLVNLSKISSSMTKKGENWSCEVVASDGEYNSSYLMGNITILNSAPYFNQNITNKSVSENSSFYYDINCSDDDSDVLAYYINNSAIFAINSSDGVISGTPGFNDAGVYYYNITCGDGTANTSQILNMTIRNTNRIPEMVSSYVNSTLGTNTTYENLTCWANATDADGQSLNYTGYWYRDGVANISFNATTNSASGSLVNISTLLNSSVIAGENWSCYARAYDSENYSSYMMSNGVVVLAVCGNLVCESVESCSSCSVDCGVCSSTPSGGGGGGGGFDLFTPTDSQLSAGFSQTYTSSDRMMFAFNGDYHYVILVSISGEYANLLVQSIPIRFSLKAGEQNKIDINDDGVYDIIVSVTRVSGGSADVSVQRVIESMQEYQPPVSPPVETPIEEIPPAEEEQAPIPEIAEEEKSYLGLIIFSFILLIAMVAAAIFLLRKRSRKERIASGIKWVKDAREKGYGNKEINHILHEKGWTRGEIKIIMEHAESRMRRVR